MFIEPDISKMNSRSIGAKRGLDISLLGSEKTRKNSSWLGFAQKVTKSMREAVSEPEAVATGSSWVKTSLRKQVFFSET